jgi:dihydropteroate synthase
MASASHPLTRPTFNWRLRTRTLALGARTAIMAILNLTPDSFSDGGHYNTLTRATTRALQLLDHGADILDLGGESTRPNAIPITPEEEQSRVLPVLEEILHHRPEAILSVDTFHASTARRALETGAEIVNDVSGFTWDPHMAAACATQPCGVVLTHTRGRPQDWTSLPALPPAEILPAVLTGLRDSLQTAESAGIASDRIVLDPGFGFGKRGPENYTLLAHLAELHQLHLPILSGTSRKGFLGRALAHFHHHLAAPADARILASQAANVAAILAGAHLLRVHDVCAARESVTIADAILANA